jgi:hypothetical protein
MRCLTPVVPSTHQDDVAGEWVSTVGLAHREQNPCEPPGDGGSEIDELASALSAGPGGALLTPCIRMVQLVPLFGVRAVGFENRARLPDEVNFAT